MSFLDGFDAGIPRARVLPPFVFVPGHYLSLKTNPANSDLTDSALISRLEEPGFVGAHRRYQWRLLETADGVFDFTGVQSDLDILAGIDRTLHVFPEWRTYNGEKPTPDYLDAFSHPSGASGEAPDGVSTMMWHQTPVLKYIRLIDALYSEFGEHPAFAGCLVQETALGVQDITSDAGEASANGYTALIQRDAWIQLLRGVSAAMPNKQVIWFANYIDSTIFTETSIQMITDIIDVIRDDPLANVTLAGPDILQDDNGLVNGVYTLYPQYPTVKKGCSVQNNSYSESNYRPRDQWEFARGDLQISQCYWNDLTTGGAFRITDAIENPINAHPTWEPGGQYAAVLQWDPVLRNVDNSFAFTIAGFKVKYGRATGIYTDSYDMGANGNRSIRYAITGTIDGTALVDGESVFAVVSTIDAHGVESADSSEIELTVRDQYPRINTLAWSQVTSVPASINAPGNYRLASNLTSNSGVAIEVAAADVNLSLDGYTLTFQETSFGNAIETNDDRFELFGGTIQQGSAGVAAGTNNDRSDSKHMIYLDGGADIILRDLNLIMDDFESAGGQVTYVQAFNAGTGLRVERCNIEAVATETAEDDMDGPALFSFNKGNSQVTFYQNTININNVNNTGQGSRPTMVRLPPDKLVWIENNITIGSNVHECQGLQYYNLPIVNFQYIWCANNTWSDASEKSRLYTFDGGRSVYIMGDTVSGKRTTNVLGDFSDTAKFVGIRDSSRDMVIAYNAYDAMAVADTQQHSFLFLGSNGLNLEAIPGINQVVPDRTYVHHNALRSSADGSGLLEFQGSSSNLHTWANTYTLNSSSSGVFAALYRSNKEFFTSTSRDDVLPQNADGDKVRILQYADAEVNPSMTMIIENSWTPNEVDLITGGTGPLSITYSATGTYPGTTTPKPPIGLREIVPTRAV